MPAILTPDSKVAPMVFLTFLVTVALACVAAIWKIFSQQSTSTEAIVNSVGCLLVFGLPLALLLAEFRRFRSFVLTEKGIAFLSFVRKPAPRFLAFERTYVDWSEIEKLELKGQSLNLHSSDQRFGINLLWFRDPSAVVAFVGRYTNIVVANPGAPRP